MPKAKLCRCSWLYRRLLPYAGMIQIRCKGSGISCDPVSVRTIRTPPVTLTVAVCVPQFHIQFIPAPLSCPLQTSASQSEIQPFIFHCMPDQANMRPICAAASFSTGAYSCKVSWDRRLTGPDTDSAAAIFPLRSIMGTDTAAAPGSRSS